MDTTTRSRRDLLRLGAGAAAGVAAGAAVALAAPVATLAATGDTMHVGDELTGDLPTSLAVSTGNAMVVVTGDAAGIALTGHATNVAGGVGVYGASQAGIAVSGESQSGSAVKGVSASSYGVYGSSTSGDGVFGATVSGSGVHGASNTGPGVEGWSGTGPAIKATGKLDFNRSGKATIAKGTSSIKVAVPGGVTTATLGFANLRVHNAGVYVTAVIPVPSTGKLWIRLNKPAPAAMTVSWFAVR